jgi:WXXGXW repeat (2 copies)
VIFHRNNVELPGFQKATPGNRRCKERFMAIKKKIPTLFMAALIAIFAMTISCAQANAGIFISVGIAPPALPVYVQPPLPAAGYIWTPGYWGYGGAGYYWVPGVWVQPPMVGVLWTPGYWGFAGGAYGWHGGYWGPHVGFYGGVNYGFGYGGIGFCGGEWRGGAFAYNGAVANFGSVHVTNVYVNRTVVTQNTIVNENHASFNGGTGGIQARATPAEMSAANERHMEATPNQMQHQTAASQDRSQLASVNHGRPATTASSSTASYHQVAARNAQSQPISKADQEAGKSYNPNNREANQDQRVANGLRSGQMTSGEAARADRTQSAIDQQVHNDRAANGGKLTGQEKQQINGEQNAASRQIYDEKHNGNTVKPNEVDNREANQQQRTANGLRSGQETSGEAARTNQRQANVDQQVHNDRTANGGSLSKQEKQQVNKEQNRDSKQIHNQKHNGNTAGKKGK